MEFVKEENKETNRYKINITRAINAGIIVKEEDGEGGIIVYKVGNTIIGSNEDQCIAWFKQNKHVYENTVLANIPKTVAATEYVPEVTAEKTDTLKTLQDQAKILIEQGLIVHNTNLDFEPHLKETVEEAIGWRKQIEPRFKDFKTIKNCIEIADPDNKVFKKGWWMKSKSEIIPKLIKHLEEKFPENNK